MTDTNQVNCEDELDEVPIVNGVFLDENERHHDEDCGCVIHPDCYQDGELILPVHLVRKCKCKSKQYPDSAPSKDELHDDPNYGYKIIEEFSSEGNSHKHSAKYLRTKQLGTPGQTSNQQTNEVWGAGSRDEGRTNESRSRSTQKRAQYARQHAGYGG